MLIDRNSSVPAFIQVEQDLRRQIMSGRVANGSRLPREIILAEKYGVSRVTIRRGLEELEKAGLIERIHGVGTLVRSPAEQISCDLDFMIGFAKQLIQEGYQPKVDIDQHIMVAALPDEFGDWGETAEGPFIFLQRIVKVNDRPLVLNRSWVSSGYCPGLESRSLIGDSLWKTLETCYDIVPDRSDSRIEIVHASTQEAKLLLCNDSAPLLRVQATVRDVKEKIIEYCSVLWSGEVRLKFSSLRPTVRNSGRPTL